MKETNPLYISVVFVKAFFTMVIGFLPIWGCLSITIGLLGVYIGVIEGIGWQDGLYFSFITGTTIGYGDIVPTLPATRMLSVLIAIIGVVNTGLIAAISVNAGRIAANRTGLIDDIKQKLDGKFGNKS